MAFGANLAEMVDELGIEVRTNLERLPSFFIYRYVPGRETLFDGLYRVLGGELVTLEADRIQRRQLRTLAHFTDERPIGRDAHERFDELMGRILADCRDASGGAMGGLLSGGVDSSLIQAIWGRSTTGTREPAPRSYCVDLDHPKTRPDTEYALDAAQVVGSQHMLVPVQCPVAEALVRAIVETGEAPNHMQGTFMRGLAEVMVAEGVTAGASGQGADALFGFSEVTQLQLARLARTLAPFATTRRLARTLAATVGWPAGSEHFALAERLFHEEDAGHPINQVASFTEWPAIAACFGADGVDRGTAYRRALVDHYCVPGGPLERTVALELLSESSETAPLWAAQFALEGAEMLFPFLDSRMVRFAMNLDPRLRFPFRRPKRFLKDALARHATPELANRPKRAFGLPIFEWLASRGALRPLVDRIGEYDFVDRAALAEARERPNWFLYTLLCYDLWHKRFIYGMAAERILAPAKTRPAASTINLSPV
jgi:asparagine synthase (glutamine-hydrolysing)